MCCGGHQQGFRLQTESVFLSFNMRKKTKLDSQHMMSVMLLLNVNTESGSSHVLQEHAQCPAQI